VKKIGVNKEECMTRNEQLDFLIRRLSPSQKLPQTVDGKWRVFRALVNVREPAAIGEDFIKVQDELLQSLIAEAGIVDVDDLSPLRDNLYVWRGDIIRLKVDAIVNAANSAMLGCFIPDHSCIDNAIHTFAGVQLRNACAEIMRTQGSPEPMGVAKITSAYNLPCKYILHTVGPVIHHCVSHVDRDLLASCYYSCLERAHQNAVKSIAFCCISTGEFRFPNVEAARIAIHTVSDFLKAHNGIEKIVFNVFTDRDERIYRLLLD
jgi:O-acetyl-ADP-ribose deacetylase (regulator of RNase III)